MRRLAALAVLAFALVACRSEDVTIIPAGELPADVYGSPAPPAEAHLPHRGTVYMIRTGRLVPVQRTLQGISGSLPEALLSALLQGPLNQDDVRTAIPPDTRVNQLAVLNGVATVDLSEEFEEAGPGKQLTLRVAQVVYSLTSDPSIRGVLFSIDGEPRSVPDDTGTELFARPMERSDYDGFAPSSA